MRLNTNCPTLIGLGLPLVITGFAVAIARRLQRRSSTLIMSRGRPLFPLGLVFRLGRRLGRSGGPGWHLVWPRRPGRQRMRSERAVTPRGPRRRRSGRERWLAVGSGGWWRRWLCWWWRWWWRSRPIERRELDVGGYSHFRRRLPRPYFLSDELALFGSVAIGIEDVSPLRACPLDLEFRTRQSRLGEARCSGGGFLGRPCIHVQVAVLQRPGQTDGPVSSQPAVRREMAFPAAVPAECRYVPHRFDVFTPGMVRPPNLVARVLAMPCRSAKGTFQDFIVGHDQLLLAVRLSVAQLSALGASCATWAGPREMLPTTIAT